MRFLMAVIRDLSFKSIEKLPEKYKISMNTSLVGRFTSTHILISFINGQSYL